MDEYGVLKGRAPAFKRDDDDSPHSEVLIDAAGKHRIAINVRSSRGPMTQRLVGEARTFTLSGRGAQLGNDGGTITLLDDRGLKVDGVAYTQADARAQGRALAF